MDLLNHFHPVLHYFFIEHFPSMEQWFTNRNHYIYTTSLYSIYGYLLGIGDRHMKNILIENDTGNIIHIDFGIVFEQGRYLSIPEVIPFRYTQNIIDPFGLSGDEKMKRYMKSILRILANNKEIILTLLKVFLHDPLYRWCLETKNIEIVKARKYTDGSQDAQLAIHRVHDKLEFKTEEGMVHNVDDYITILINTARDNTKLCHLFPGWAPYL